MAVRHHLVKSPPSAVWEVLSDPDRYAEWVVGTEDTRPLYGTWPEVGAALQYTVAIGPVRLSGSTVVRLLEPPNRLELEVKSGPAGTARVAIEVVPWGEDTLVVIDEHPLRGLGARLHNTLFEAAIQLRHRRMLRRLAEVVEGTRTAATA
ncbi:SRPBCC family protein [Streptomyces sudanensis]|uniref:SRPBCC family protein n=1 Tax=Streptomyces sudanensis TaxID=436397 RepID=UPI0020CF0020|nr:SRPBCC family protein [Streptomyces sudanensis]MCP9985545.1 SRPBCC family protein [Streptomyces sudanensis]